MKKPAADVVVASWNVLAQAYVLPDRYAASPPAALDASSRERLIRSIAATAGDVVCLQEAEPHLVDGWGGGVDVFWSPDGSGRPAGCVTLVRRRPGLRVVGHERIEYHDQPEPTGRVLQLVHLDVAGTLLTVANTHLRWESAGTSDGDHVGLREAAEVIATLDTVERAVVCSDTNDEPSGPVRELFRAAGFTEVQRPGVTCLANGMPAALDVIAARGVSGSPTFAGGSFETGPLPSLTFPSDHYLIAATITTQAGQ